jgi:hypothetical protein
MEEIYIKHKKITLSSIFLLIILFVNSCSLFKNKDDCDTCPKWSTNENYIKQNPLNHKT